MQALLALLALVGSTLVLAIEQQGVYNCLNKCEKVFDRTQYAISDEPGQDTFEFRSCVIGCGFCQTELDANSTTDTCFTQCKTYNYTASGIRKGVIEPDKACLMGCVINTCQLVCIGGSLDMLPNPSNQYLFWGYPGSTGCSIKTALGYVQNPNYGNPNNPQGQGGDNAVKQCCTNAMNMCQYHGNASPSNPNYARVVKVTQKSCAQFVPQPKNLTAICGWFNNTANCGSSGMPGI